MPRKIAVALLVFVLAALSAVFYWYSTKDTVVLADGARLTGSECWFKNDSDYSIRCAYYSPAPQKNRAYEIRLPVVYVQINPRKRHPEPILYIVGGPGHSAGFDRLGVAGWLSRINHLHWERDLVIFDQRGTGMSTPALGCNGLVQSTLRMLQMPHNEEQDAKYWQQFMQTCYQELKSQNLDFGDFTTPTHSQDVLALMQLIPAKAWHIYGVSYGTRVALHLLKTPPATLKSVTLDSVYPTNKNELLVVPELMNFALDRLFKACADHYFCQKQVPDLRATFKALTKTLDQKPARFLVKAENHPGEIEVYLSGSRLAWAVFMALYQRELINTLPATIKNAAQGDQKALASLAKEYAQWSLETTFSPGAFYAVECHDRPTEVSDADYEKEWRKYPFVHEYTQYQAQYDICRFWKSGRTNAAFLAPTQSRVPTLILNGEMDPVTPWYWAESITQNLERHYYFKIPGIGHGAADSDDCAAQLVKEFMAAPQKKPELSCTRAWRPPLFKFPKKNDDAPDEPIDPGKPAES